MRFSAGSWLKLKTDLRFEISDRNDGGESVLVNGAVFKTVSETVRTGSGRFDSYTPPPKDRSRGGRQRAGAEGRGQGQKAVGSRRDCSFH